MATFTPYLNLEKPTTSERLDVLKINANWDKIDAGVSAINSQLITGNSFSDGGVIGYKMGRVVFLQIGSTATMKSDGKTLDFTMPSAFYPILAARIASKVWNESSYVDCSIGVDTSGNVTITTPGSAAISNIQPSFVQNKPIVYMSAS